ncbi:MAG: TolC family protein [Opitutales bacterium]|nr:TolC family protein [Opitutales bacterium]
MRRLGVMCIVLFASLPAIGTSASLTLAECWERIESGNPSLREVGYRIESARLSAEQAGAWTNPRLGATLRSDEREFELSQGLDVWGKRRLAQRAAAFETDLRRLDGEALRRELFAEVASHFWRGALLAEVVDLKEEQLGLWADFMNIREEEVRMGAIAPSEILPFREVLAEQRQILEEIRLDARNARAALNILMGRAPGAELSLEPEGASIPLPSYDAFDEALREAVERNPALEQSRLALQQSERRVEQERRERLPEFAAGPSFKESGGSVAAGVAVTISLPVWDRNRQGTESARREASAARERIREAELTLTHDVYRAFQAYRSRGRLLNAFSTEVAPAAAERHTRAEQAWKTGNLSRRDYLSEQISYLSQRQRELQLRLDREISAARLAALVLPSDQI